MTSPTPKVITEKIPENYRDLPPAERTVIARRLAGQLRAGLGHGTIGSHAAAGEETS
jgi:hypothetical protein